MWLFELGRDCVIIGDCVLLPCGHGVCPQGSGRYQDDERSGWRGSRWPRRLRSWILRRKTGSERVAGTVDQDMASTLFGVQGVEVVEVDVESDGRLRVWLATHRRSVPSCPDCAGVARRGHEDVLTSPGDLPRPAGSAAARGVGDVSVVWMKRRWRCDYSGCGRVTFTESVP